MSAQAQVQGSNYRGSHTAYTSLACTRPPNRFNIFFVSPLAAPHPGSRPRKEADRDFQWSHYSVQILIF